MSAAVERPFGVPRESLGQARALRNTLVTNDALATKTVERIAAPLQARTSKGSIPRPELLTEASCLWREKLAGPGRLSLDIQQARNRLLIRELRLGAADFYLPDWDTEVEAGFAILIMELAIQRRSCKIETATLVSLSLHAVARWYQRAWNTTPDALAADVSMLAAAIDRLDLTSDSKFSIPVASGRWVGSVWEVADEEHLMPVLAVRTFLNG